MIKENSDSAVCANIISGDIEIKGSCAVPILKNEILGKVLDENGKAFRMLQLLLKDQKKG
jgi:hypothetical protein